MVQGHHDWQGPQGLGLAWILQNRKWRRQGWHAAGLAATVAALPACQKLAVAALQLQPTKNLDLKNVIF